MALIDGIGDIDSSEDLESRSLALLSENILTKTCHLAIVHASAGRKNLCTLGCYIEAGRPCGASGYPRPWYRSVRELSRVRAPPRVHTRINSYGLFSCARIDLQKARERELANTR